MTANAQGTNNKAESRGTTATPQRRRALLEANHDCGHAHGPADGVKRDAEGHSPACRLFWYTSSVGLIDEHLLEDLEKGSWISKNLGVANRKEFECSTTETHHRWPALLCIYRRIDLNIQYKTTMSGPAETGPTDSATQHGAGQRV